MEICCVKGKVLAKPAEDADVRGILCHENTKAQNFTKVFLMVI
jgi:hypothetical protein